MSRLVFRRIRHCPLQQTLGLGELLLPKEGDPGPGQRAPMARIAGQRLPEPRQ